MASIQSSIQSFGDPAPPTRIGGAIASFGAPEDVPISDQIKDPKLTDDQRAALITQWQIKRGMVRPDDPATNPNFGPAPPPGTPATEPGVPGAKTPAAPQAKPGAQAPAQAPTAPPSGAPPTALGVKANMMGGDPFDIAVQKVRAANEDTDALLKAKRDAMPGILKQELDRYDKDQQTIAATLEQTKQLAVDLDASLPKWDVDKEMERYTTPPEQQFGSAGVIFAMLASAFTHTPMINALNGAAAAMKAIQEGDMNRYNIARQAWQDNTKLAFDRNEKMSALYKNVLDLAKEDMAAATERGKELARQFDDPIAMDAISRQNWVDWGNLIINRDKAQAAAARVTPQMFIDGLMTQWVAKYTQDNGHPPSIDEQAQKALEFKGQVPQVDDKTLQGWVQSRLAGEQVTQIAGSGRGSGFLQAQINKATMDYRENVLHQDPRTAGLAQAMADMGYKSSASAANNIQRNRENLKGAVIQLERNLDVLEPLMKNATEVQISTDLTAVARAIAMKTGDVGLAGMQVALYNIVMENARIAEGGTSSAAGVSVDSVKNSMNLISSGTTYEQMFGDNGVVSVIRADARNKTDAADIIYAETLRGGAASLPGDAGGGGAGAGAPAAAPETPSGPVFDYNPAKGGSLTRVKR